MDVEEFEKYLKSQGKDMIMEKEKIIQEINEVMENFEVIDVKVENDSEIIDNKNELKIENKKYDLIPKLFNSKEEKNDNNANILVAGMTGVGKSSLINYIFGNEVAPVGTGNPITQKIEEYEIKNHNITLYDTKGIEVADYTETLNEIKDFLEIKQNLENPREHIHIAWLCISEIGGRIQVADRKLLEILKKENIPTIAVFTKMLPRKESEFVNKVEEEKLLGEVDEYVRVRSVEEHIEDEGITLNKKGAEELLDKTSKYVDEGIMNAINKAQKVSVTRRLNSMKLEAEQLTNKASLLSAGVGAVPLPFADSIALTGIQTKLIMDINTIYRVDSGTHVWTDIAAVIISITGISQIGKAAASTLKLIPGLNLIGMGINAGVAAGITKGIGFAYSEYLYSIANKETGEIKIDLDDLKNNFLNLFNKFKDMK